MDNFVRLWASFLLFGFTCENVLIMEMVVPSHVEKSSDVTLRCSNNLEDDFMLYSIKWYKDSREFFGVTHRQNSTQFNVLSHPNFTIQYDEQEKGAVVHLKEVTREAEGRYTCEITIDAPLFYTDYREGNLTIYEISSPGPLLVGHPKNNLKNGNQLRYTCSFRKSKPKPVLSWFVDNQELVGKLEFRYVMELPTPMDMRCCGSTLEWWSVQSELSIWPTAAQVEKEICIVSCRIVVLNASIYQRVASISTTSTANFPHVPTNYTRNFQVSTSGKGDSKSAKVFLRVEFFLFVLGLFAAFIALHALAFHPLFFRD